MRRRSLTVLGVIMAGCLALTACSSGQEDERTGGANEPAFDPYQKDLGQLGSALDAGRTSSEELVRYYRDRIETYDDRGPGVNAVIALNDRALEQARTLDQERRREGSRGPLHGIPIVVKDNYDVAGMPTTAGSVALADAYPTENSVVVQRLIDAGAIVLAKVNMSELAASYGRLGYSSVGGLTLNPYNLDRNAAGSSSGTAAAVAADFAVLGVGTDTSGSVRAPAATTGLVGVRPTTGLTSPTGIVPLALSFDSPGPMARTVTGAAVALSAMAGPEDDRIDYTAGLDADALENARIGVVEDFSGGNEEVDELVGAAVQRMEELGATTVPVSLTPRMSRLWQNVLGPIGDMEFRHDFESYLATLRPGEGTPESLAEVIAISESPEVRGSDTPVNPARIDGLRAAMDASERDNGAAYQRIMNEDVSRARSEIDSHLDAENLDALVFPTMSCPASPRYDQEDPTYRCDADDPFLPSYVASAIGYPEVTMPVGADSQGLPVGMSFLGPASGEQGLLGLAYALEQANDYRTLPASTPKLPQHPSGD